MESSVSRARSSRLRGAPLHPTVIIMILIGSASKFIMNINVSRIGGKITPPGSEMGWQRSFLIPRLVPRNGAHCSSGRRRPAPVAPVLVLQPVRPCPRPGPGALRSTSHALGLLSDREGSSSRSARTVRFAEPNVHQCNIHLLGSRGKPARRGRQSHLAVQYVRVPLQQAFTPPRSACAPLHQG